MEACLLAGRSLRSARNLRHYDQSYAHACGIRPYCDARPRGRRWAELGRMLLTLLAFPLVMGSYWAFVPTGVAAAMLVMRTVLEDRFLIRALPGYVGYAAKTRFRLIPGVL